MEYTEKQVAEMPNEKLEGEIIDGLTEIESTIFSLIKEHIIITPYEMAKRMKMPISEIEGILMQLAEKGIMTHVGNKRTGYWKIIRK